MIYEIIAWYSKIVFSCESDQVYISLIKPCFRWKKTKETKLKYLYNMNLTKLVKEIEEIPTKPIYINNMDENIYNFNLDRLRMVTAVWAVRDKRFNCGAVLIVIKMYKYMIYVKNLLLLTVVWCGTEIWNKSRRI